MATKTNIVQSANGSVSTTIFSPTASSLAGWDSNKNLSGNNFLESYTTTATAASTTTLVVGSTQLQYFTGTTTQTVLLPVVSTLVLGQSFTIVNNSTGVVTVQSSGANTIQAMAASTVMIVTCISLSGTGTASWNYEYVSKSSIQGIITVSGDSGSVTGTSVSLISGLSSDNCGRSVNFVGSGTTMTMNLTDSARNTVIGLNAGAAATFTGGYNTSVGSYSMANNTVSGQYNACVGINGMVNVSSGSYNTAMGGDCAVNVTTGSYNTYIGYSSGYDQPGGGLSGNYNTCIGALSASLYTAAEASNILINSNGVANESHILRIGAGTGTGTQQLTTAYISGINGVNVSSSTLTCVSMTSGSDQLGTVTMAAGAGITLTPTANTITIAATGASGILTLDGDSGSATGSTVTLSGGSTGLTTSASSATVDLTGTLVVANGGTGDASFTAYGVVCGGTTSTGALQNVSGLGTATYVLTSNGAGALPTWQVAPGAGGGVTIVDADSGSCTGSTITISGGSTGLTTTASSATLDLTGVLTLASGGTNANLTASNGGIFYSTATAGAILSGTATAGQLLLSGSSTAPTWSTSTYPSTNAANTLLYASSANTMAALATANNGVLITSNSGVPSYLTPGTSTYVLTSNGSGSPPSWQVTGAGGTGFSWVDQNSSTVTMAPATAYVMDDGATLITATLPTTAAFGSEFKIVGKGSGLWTVAQNSGQTIILGSKTTTSGTGGSLSSTLASDCLNIVCTTANTVFTVYTCIGNITVT